MSRTLAHWAACIIAVSFALAFPAPAREQTQPVIRLGIGLGDSSAEGYYAQEAGFFKRAGLRVDIMRFRSGSTIATGVAAGNIDVGISSIPVLGQRIIAGEQLVVIAGGAVYSPQNAFSALCVASSSPFHTAADFVGKTIAIPVLGDQSYLGTLAWLEQSHVDTSKVHFIAIPYTEMAAGIENHLADAAFLTEPWLSLAVRTGKFRVLAREYDVMGPQFLIGVWFTKSKWYDDHRDLARRFVQVIYETARWANTHHDQTAVLLARFSKIDVQTILAMKRAPFATSLDPALLQPSLDLAFRYHAIDRALNASALITKDAK
jgi:NitT/TauT family transport system substrate-binding protein